MSGKQEVINPLQHFTSIGEEIEEILSSKEISMDTFFLEMGWGGADIKSITKLNKSQINKIEKLINEDGISTYLLNFQKDYKELSISAIETFKRHQKIYKKVHHLTPLLREDFTSGMDILEDISDFLNIENEEEILDKVHENIALYRISSFKPNSLNLYAWLRRGEVDFYKQEYSTYDKNGFVKWIEDGEWKKNLKNLDYVYSLPQTLEQFGIALVYTPHLEKTVFGAVRWFEKRPLVQVSDKGKCLATFWYTLFHEFGHVILHENDEIFEGTLDLPASKINKKERDANAFAYDHLFNGDKLRKYLFSVGNKFVGDSFIEETSNSFKVDKMFVAFWMKKAQIKSKTIYENTVNLQFK